MEGLKQVLNERFSRDDLKEYGVSFEFKVEENQELILSYKNSKFSVKIRDENLDDWICAANTYNSNKDKLSLDSGFIYLSDLNENKIEFRLQTLKTVSNYISFSNIQEYKFNTEKGVVKIGYLSKNMIFSIFNSDLYKDLFLHRVLP
ncbi:hypothetical protein ABFP04_13255, partial [Acinetobacter towneri]|uniref:hypothetical protein n=1 Tax=Acinetobacter towneri TaxID=202956 RepID=UPI003213363B